MFPFTIVSTQYIGDLEKFTLFQVDMLFYIYVYFTLPYIPLIQHQLKKEK